MSNAETLIENLRKAQANLDAANEQNSKARQILEKSSNDLVTARNTYDKALEAIVQAASD